MKWLVGCLVVLVTAGKPNPSSHYMGREARDFQNSFEPFWERQQRQASQATSTVSQQTYEPGQLADSTNHHVIENALTDVLMSAIAGERRCAAIGLACQNGSSELTDPHLYIKSGHTHSTLAPHIQPGQTGLALYTKRAGWLEGTSGIQTYDIVGTDHQVSLLWRVPYLSSFFSHFFNVKIYPKGTVTDDDLFEQMFEYAGPWRAGQIKYRSEYGINVMGVMSESRRSKVIVKVNTAGYNPDRGPSLHAECHYRFWRGNYCWQECETTGWCWTSLGCGHDETVCQQNSPLQCSSSC